MLKLKALALFMGQMKMMSDAGVQSSYSQYPKHAFPGLLADLGPKFVRSMLNPNVALAIGCLAVRDTNDGEAKHPGSAADITTLSKVIGPVLQSHSQESQSSGAVPNWPVNSAVPCLQRGRVWVQPEAAVTPSTPVYVRFANSINGSQTQAGSFRGDADGTAQVTTLTPTVNNNDGYWVEVLDDQGNIVATGSYESGGSATAAAIVTGLKAALGSPAYVALSGTSTLILTAATAGRGFSLNISANLTSAATTANAQSAALLPNARYLNSSANNDGFAILEISE